MNKGKVEQMGPPAEVFEHPATPFVRQFEGISPMTAEGCAGAVSGLGAQVGALA